MAVFSRAYGRCILEAYSLDSSHSILRRGCKAISSEVLVTISIQLPFLVSSLAALHAVSHIETKKKKACPYFQPRSQDTPSPSLDYSQHDKQQVIKSWRWNGVGTRLIDSSWRTFCTGMASSRLSGGEHGGNRSWNKTLH